LPVDSLFYYLDKKLYQECCAIEHTNAWMDSICSILNRYDTTITSWKDFNFIAEWLLLRPMEFLLCFKNIT